MQQFKRTLFITEKDTSLKLEGQALCACHADGRKDRVPLHRLEQIVSFSFLPASPALMTECAKNNISLVFLSQTGKLRYQVWGETRGNVQVRRSQYMAFGEEAQALKLGKTVIAEKIGQSVHLISRFIRNHPETESAAQPVREELKAHLCRLETAADAEELRGVEGSAAKLYFGFFPNMILNQEEAFRFEGRNRRPPQDRVNALLSYAYSLLSFSYAQALESAGLDPQYGFLHGERSGRCSLALDLMEEGRAVLADRFVLRLLNLNMISPEQFEESEDGAIQLDDEGRKRFLQEWSRWRQAEVELPELEEAVPRGLIPHLQAQKLARYLRGEQEPYCPLEVPV